MRDGGKERFGGSIAKQPNGERGHKSAARVCVEDKRGRSTQDSVPYGAVSSQSRRYFAE